MPFSTVKWNRIQPQILWTRIALPEFYDRALKSEGNMPDDPFIPTIRINTPLISGDQFCTKTPNINSSFAISFVSPRQASTSGFLVIAMVTENEVSW
jgi:hypothetical protein